MGYMKQYSGLEKEIAGLSKKADLSRETFTRLKEKLSEGQIKFLLDFNDIKDKDIENIIFLGKLVKSKKVEISNKFYDYLLGFEKTRKILLSEDGLLERLKKTQAEYFESLFSGKYDGNYILSRLIIGFSHHKYGVTPSVYMGAYDYYITLMFNLLKEEAGAGNVSLEEAFDIACSIKKLIMVDATLAIETYYEKELDFNIKLQKDKNKLDEISKTDTLTGIYNRRMFEESLSELTKLSTRYNRPLSLIMFDIDDFKQINDSFGHKAGDRVLSGLSLFVKEIIRDTDIFARIGGEEFIIICPETDLDGAARLAEKIRSSVEAKVFPGIGKITISLGVDIYNKEQEIGKLLGNVDKAMYMAKNAGKNAVGVGGL